MPRHRRRAQLTGARARFLEKTVDSFPPPWRRSGCRRQEAAGGDRCRTDADHHQVRRERSGLHQRIRDWCSPREATSRGCRPPRSRSARQSAEAQEDWKAGGSRCRRPDYMAVMTYLDDADDPRASLSRPSRVRATSGERDNRPLIARILELRREKAALLGFAQLRRPGAGRSHGAQRRPRALRSWKI